MQGQVTEGYLLVDKPKGKTSFSLIRDLRRRLGVKKIGHSGTLDPFATGVMILLIGRNYTKLSDTFLTQDKEYEATLLFGKATDSYDCEGNITAESQKQVSLDELQAALAKFQGEIMQVPPMYSAKKVGGQKLYDLARQGKEVPRAPVKVTVNCTLLSFSFPTAKLRIQCSKGTYIRSIAHDLGIMLGSFAHLTELTRTRSGKFCLTQCIAGEKINDPKEVLPIQCTL